MAEFVFDAVEARFGDCILIRWGANGDRVMLVDGGPGSTWEDRLEPVIDDLRSAFGIGVDDPLPLELAAVSHIDGDHVLGIEQLLKALREARENQLAEKVRIERFWFNAFDNIVTGGEPVPASVMASLGSTVAPSFSEEVDAVLSSVTQGRRTRDLARRLHLPGNMANGELVRSGDTLSLPEGVEITVVAPASDELDALQTLWKETPVPEQASLAENIDDSIPNLSSIVMHVQRGSATALLTGDARGDLIRSALGSAGLLDAAGELHVGVLKVQHHGSRNNMEPLFFEKITADHYVISANGHHHHPSEDTLRAIVDARGGATYTIHLTNAVPHAVSLLQEEVAKPEHHFAVDVRGDDEPKLSFEVG